MAAGGDQSEARRKAGTALGWAIGAAVAAGLALLLGVTALVVAVTGGAGDPFLEDEGFYEPIRGEVIGFVEGQAVSGDDLERQITRQQSADGFQQNSISCPDTPSVRTSSAIVCTGELDGYEWTGVVFIEDSVGSWVLLEL